MSNADKKFTLAESILADLIEKNPDDWANRKKLAHLLYDADQAEKAAEIIWKAPEIPPIDLELGFAIKVLSKGTPRRAIRLLTFLQESNKDKPAQNLGIANALLNYGMVLQSARFYGAAMAGDPSLANPDLEHFLLWVDDKEKIWGDFSEESPDLATLPWMKRDKDEAASLEAAMLGHTTPIKIPNLSKVTSEDVVNEMYKQSSAFDKKVTPPPSVTIAREAVKDKDIVYDDKLGAAQSAPPPVAAPAAKAKPELAKNEMGVTAPVEMTAPGAKESVSEAAKNALTAAAPSLPSLPSGPPVIAPAPPAPKFKFPKPDSV